LYGTSPGEFIPLPFAKGALKNSIVELLTINNTTVISDLIDDTGTSDDVVIIPPCRIGTSRELRVREEAHLRAIHLAVNFRDLFKLTNK
jgi:hypothetical protein